MEPRSYGASYVPCCRKGGTRLCSVGKLRPRVAVLMSGDGAVQISDGGPLERFERLLERPVDEVMGEVCARVVEGDSLRTVARDMGLPVARFMTWVASDDERRGMYEGALRLRADELVHESLDMATKDPAKTALYVAGLWDRKRFGRGDGGGVGLKVVVNRFGGGSDESHDQSVEITAQGD